MTFIELLLLMIILLQIPSTAVHNLRIDWNCKRPPRARLTLYSVELLIDCMPNIRSFDVRNLKVSSNSCDKLIFVVTVFWQDAEADRSASHLAAFASAANWIDDE